jgi:para-nitrobenzyl esterase
MTSVTVAQGKLLGATSADGAVSIFKGVPYAAPPVGDLRWRLPQPAMRWEGGRPADSFAPNCPQFPLQPRSLYAGGHENQSEDCLYLNVWSTSLDPAERKPVFVFVHLGGFQYGGPSIPVYDGQALARRGLVVVTLTNRLNRFGFFAHPWLTAESEYGVSGNYGLHDQLAALGWIQENIAAFGGDPDRVTLGGISAGSMATSGLMASPLATGLFHRAIGESGALLGPVGESCNTADQMQALESAERDGLALTASLGVRDLSELRGLPAERILEAPFTPPGEVEWIYEAAGGPFFRGAFDTAFPIVDGRLFPESPLDTYARGGQMAIPLITGSVAKEGTGCPHVPTYRGFVEDARLEYGDHAEEFLALYPASGDADVRDPSAASFADRVFASQNWTWARLHAAVAPAYYYHFTRVPPIPRRAEVMEPDPGAYHSAEVPFVFGNLDVHDWDWTAADRRLAEEISSYWARFAKEGDPNGEGRPDWPRFDARAPRAMGFGEHTDLIDVPDRERLGFWDRFLGRAALFEQPG